MTLDQVPKDKEIIVENISGCKKARLKLGAMGVHQGCNITVVNKSVLGGPIIVQINGNTNIAIGRGLAKKVEINE